MSIFNKFPHNKNPAPRSYGTDNGRVQVASPRNNGDKGC